MLWSTRSRLITSSLVVLSSAHPLARQPQHRTNIRISECYGAVWVVTSCSLDEKRVTSHRETQAPRQQLDTSFRLPCTGPRGAQLRRLYAQPEELSVRRLCVTTMSAATASIADVSRTDTANKNERNKSGKRDGIEKPDAI